MCSGAWRTYGLPIDLEIHYIDEDLGKNGQNTAFDQGSFAYEQANLFWTHFTSVQSSLSFPYAQWTSWTQTSWSMKFN